MLETDGIEPKLTNEPCEELLCQQYWYRGKLNQEVDALLLKVKGRWHQLYFDNGVVFWRLLGEPPRAAQTDPDNPFAYPLVDIGAAHGLKGRTITECATEPLVDGARVSFVFEGFGTLMVKCCDGDTSLRFLPG